MVIYMGNYSSATPMRGVDHMEPEGIGVSQCLYMALSHGELAIRSRDPRQQPRIDLNLLDHPFDLERMRASVRMCTDLFEHKSFDGIVEERSGPSAPVLEDDEALDLWTLRNVITAHHVSSTCRMGPADDETAVVNQYGRVHGIQGLRVVDASIMPAAVRANPNLTVIATAEMAADFNEAMVGSANRRPRERRNRCGARAVGASWSWDRFSLKNSPMASMTPSRSFSVAGT